MKPAITVRCLVVLAALAPLAAFAAPAAMAGGSICGRDPRDWCPAPAGDPCGEHREERSCRADHRCAALPYQGESVVACEPDGSGFFSNCPAVGCVSRYDAPGKPPRPGVIADLCTPPIAIGNQRTVQVWRTAQREAALFEVRLRGPVGHPFDHFFDVGGRSIYSLSAAGARPKLEASRQRLVAGLVAAEVLTCPSRTP